MKDLRTILLGGLLPKLETVTGKKAYTRLPKQSQVSPPYLFVSQIFQSEDGPKTGFIYSIEALISIVYNNITSNASLYTDMDSVLSFVNNREPFTISGGYKIESCELISSNDDETSNPDGTTDTVGLIRLKFNIK